MKKKKNTYNFKNFENCSEYEQRNFYRHELYELKVENDAGREWDSIIVLEKAKLIINIEVKTGNNEAILNNAAKQTRNHLVFFRKIFGCLLSNEWKFVTAVCMTNYVFESQKTVPCNQCKNFVLSKEELYNVKPWLNRITSSEPNIYSDNRKNEYEDLLVRLIGYASIQKTFQMTKLFFDPVKYRENAERILTGEDSGITGEGGLKGELRFELEKGYENFLTPKCFMLTFAQLQAVHHSGSNIIIMGDYGTGKTFVLKERAKMCSHKNPESKIAYLGLTCNDLSFNRTSSGQCNGSIMNFISKKEFQEFENIEVLTHEELDHHYYKCMAMNTAKASVSEVLKDFFTKNCDYEYIFIDELEARELSDFFLPNKSYCVTIKVTSGK